MGKDSLLIGFTLFSVMLLHVIIFIVILSFVPDEVKNQKCIRTELRYGNIQCITEDNR
jgi:competence protein ComGC